MLCPRSLIPTRSGVVLKVPADTWLNKNAPQPLLTRNDTTFILFHHTAWRIIQSEMTRAYVYNPNEEGRSRSKLLADDFDMKKRRLFEPEARNSTT